jgi:hypothetical protein
MTKELVGARVLGFVPHSQDIDLLMFPDSLITLRDVCLDEVLNVICKLLRF